MISAILVLNVPAVNMLQSRAITSARSSVWPAARSLIGPGESPCTESYFGTQGKIFGTHRKINFRRRPSFVKKTGPGIISGHKAFMQEATHLIINQISNRMKSSIKKQIAPVIAFLVTASVIFGFIAGDEGMTITTKSDKARTLFKEAQIEAFQTGDTKKVSGLLKQALELDPDFALANLWYGYMGFGSVERAKFMNSAFEQRDKVSEAEKHFIQAYMDMEYSKRDEAFDELKAAISLAPGDKFLPLHLAGVYEGFGKYEEALEYAKRSSEIDPEFAGAISYQGYILWEMEKNDEAEALHVKSIAMSPENTLFLNRYAQLLRSTGRIPEAIKMHEKAMKIKEEYLSALYLAHCYVADNKYPAAREKYLKAMDISTTNGQKNSCLFFAGTTWLYEGNLKEALAAFDRRIEFNRKLGGMDEYIIGTTGVKANSCLLYEDFKGYEKYLEEYKGYLTSLELSEADRIYYEQYVVLMEGFLYAYSGKVEQAEKFLDQYEKSLTESEKDTYKQDLLEMRGLIDYHKGKYKEAIVSLDKAGIMGEYFAGLSYEKLGNIEKAKETYSKISTDNKTSLPLSLTKPFARKRLAQL